jgi:Kef-type K+ transport system membrane component KefB
MRNLVQLGVLVGLTLVILRGGAPPLAADGDEIGRITLLLGFLLLAALLAGTSARDIRLPRVTGYILLGILAGPSVLGLLASEDVAALGPVDDIAISLIALAAGGELRVSELRQRGRSMAGIMLTEMTFVLVITVVGVLALSSVLPFTQDQPATTVLVIAFVFGSIAIANSPSVAIAVINDSRSRGPVASTVLGVTVMKDVLVIILFATGLAVARTILQDAGLDWAFLADLAWEVLGSLAVGAFSGWLISLYLARYHSYSVLFVLAAAFLNAQAAGLLHLEVLLMSLSAGFFVENIRPVEGERFIKAVEANALPFYALFFALAGAKIDLASLPVLAPFVAFFILIRAGAIWAGTWVGARITDAEPQVRRYAWTGFVSQAGVTLGMVVIAARVFPEWGTDLVTLFVAMVAVHELVGPVLFQSALGRAGEVGARDGEGEEAEEECSTAVV